MRVGTVSHPQKLRYRSESRLIMVAQALHGSILTFLCGSAASAEARRGSCCIAYNLCTSTRLSIIVNRYYYDVVGSFLAAGARTCRTVRRFPFVFARSSRRIRMTTQWDLDRVIGYLGTWFSSQRFIEATAAIPRTDH